MPDAVIAGEIGTTGLKRSAGIVLSEFLPQLTGARGIKTYVEMRDNDPIIGAIVLAIQNLVRTADWDVEAGGERLKDEKAAEFVQECMDDMQHSWSDFISEALSMIVFGWSFFEVVYKKRSGNVFDLINGSQYTDGRIGWKKFAPRSQESLFKWDFADNGDVLAMVQHAWPDFKTRTIPIRGNLHFRTTTYLGNPEGRSVFRNCYRPWYFKKRIEEIEGVSLDRNLTGLPKITVPARMLSDDATDEEVAALADILEMGKNLRVDAQACIVLPAIFDENNNKLMDVELMSTRSRLNIDTDRIIMRYNRTMAASALADFIIIGHDNVGSFAMASSKTKVFSTAVGSYMDNIVDYINRVAIPKLLELNGMTSVSLPKIVHGDVETIELKELATYIKALAGSGGVGFDLTDDDIREYLARQAGIPAKMEVAPEPVPIIPSNVVTDDGDDEDDDDDDT